MGMTAPEEGVFQPRAPRRNVSAKPAHGSHAQGRQTIGSVSRNRLGVAAFTVANEKDTSC